MDNNLTKIEVTMIAMSTAVVSIVTLSVLPTNTSVTLLLQRGVNSWQHGRLHVVHLQLASAIGRMIPAFTARTSETIVPLSVYYADVSR